MTKTAQKITRPGDMHSMESLDCPVFLLQEWMECSECNEVGYWKTTMGVWFTRKEAERWAKNHYYRLGTWRVYAVGARGQLKTLLSAHTVKEDRNPPSGRCIAGRDASVQDVSQEVPQ